MQAVAAKLQQPVYTVACFSPRFTIPQPLTTSPTGRLGLTFYSKITQIAALKSRNRTLQAHLNHYEYRPGARFERFRYVNSESTRASG